MIKTESSYKEKEPLLSKISKYKAFKYYFNKLAEPQTEQTQTEEQRHWCLVYNGAYDPERVAYFMDYLKYCVSINKDIQVLLAQLYMKPGGKKRINIRGKLLNY